MLNKEQAKQIVLKILEEQNLRSNPYQEAIKRDKINAIGCFVWALSISQLIASSYDRTDISRTRSLVLDFNHLTAIG